MAQPITIRFDHTQVGCFVESLRTDGTWETQGMVRYGDTLDTRRTEREIIDRLSRDYAVTVKP